MTRVSWKFTVWAVGGQTVCSSLLALTKLRPDDGWDAASLRIYTAWLAISVTYFLYLIRVRAGRLEREEAWKYVVILKGHRRRYAELRDRTSFFAWLESPLGLRLVP